MPAAPPVLLQRSVSVVSQESEKNKEPVTQRSTLTAAALEHFRLQEIAAAVGRGTCAELYNSRNLKHKAAGNKTPVRIYPIDTDEHFKEKLTASSKPCSNKS